MENTSNIIHNTLGQPQLSIIVPVYNVEKYLRKCVESLIHQDFTGYEVILVDDGSTDESGKICEELSETISDERLEIRVIHHKNGGLSVARNSGIEVARGEYVMFVDSDDYIEPNILQGLLTQMERDNLDVLRYRLQYVNPQYEVYNPYKSDPFKDNDYSSEPTDGVSFLNSRMSTACYAWQFVLRRDLILPDNSVHSFTPSFVRSLTGVLFTPGIYFEDTDWTPRMLCKAKRVASTNTVVYNYLIRKGSITNAVNRSKQKKVLDDKMHLIATLKQQAIDLRKSGRYNRWYFSMISDTVVSIIGMLSTDFYNEKDSYLDQLRTLDIFPIVNKSFKTRLINVSPRFAVELLHIKNK